jgi:hypothetical protein
VRKFLILGLAVLGALFGLVVVLGIRRPPAQPTQGLVGIFPFTGRANGKELAEELAARLTTSQAKAVALPAAGDPQLAATRAGVRLYVVGRAGTRLEAKLFDVTAPAHPRAEASGDSVEQIARQLRGGVLGAALSSDKVERR